MRLSTNISQVFGSDGKPLDDSDGPSSLFDRLLGGGLEIPDVVIRHWIDKPTNCAPIVLMISGQAGTGKTTVALELVYRLIDQVVLHPDTKKEYPFSSLFISSESPGELLVKNKVAEFGWPANWFDVVSTVAAPSTAGDGGQPPNSLGIKQDVADDDEGLRLWDWFKRRTRSKARTDETPSSDPSDVPAGGVHQKVTVVGRDAPVFAHAKSPAAFFKFLEKYCAFEGLNTEHLGERPGIVVIDSLNILPAETRGQHFLDLLYKLRGPFLLVVVLDTAPNEEGEPFWAFAVDTVIRLTQIERSDPRLGNYLLREFRIEKARWQKHALGSHQMKIFGKVASDNVHSPPMRKNYHGTGHLPPFRWNGGLQLYQSIHRHLSEGQRLVAGWENAAVVPAPIQFDPTSLPDLDTKIGGGFPRERCTAFVGDRGSLKSHLAYLWLLAATSQHDDQPALLLSLRDDEGEALSRLEAIYDVEQALRPGLRPPAELINQKRLRIAHFRPGYIAPDEFMFRLWFHVKDFRPRRVVIATLEQLDTLFPLCSVEPAFVPSLLDVLAAEKITTVAIGVSSDEQPTTQLGLLPQASLILSFTAVAVPATSGVQINVKRLPTARPSGGGGRLSLDPTDHRLTFTP